MPFLHGAQGLKGTCPHEWARSSGTGRWPVSWSPDGKRWQCWLFPFPGFCAERGVGLATEAVGLILGGPCKDTSQR